MIRFFKIDSRSTSSSELVDQFQLDRISKSITNIYGFARGYMGFPQYTRPYMNQLYPPYQPQPQYKQLSELSSQKPQVGIKFCGNYGSKNLTNARFCGACGNNFG